MTRRGNLTRPPPWIAWQLYGSVTDLPSITSAPLLLLLFFFLLLFRESGAVNALARFISQAAAVPDQSLLQRMHLTTPLAAACACVACIAQDCDEGQRQLLLMQPDFLPALMRLCTAHEPSLATEAAK